MVTDATRRTDQLVLDMIRWVVGFPIESSVHIRTNVRTDDSKTSAMYNGDAMEAALVRARDARHVSRAFLASLDHQRCALESVGSK